MKDHQPSPARRQWLGGAGGAVLATALPAVGAVGAAAEQDAKASSSTEHRSDEMAIDTIDALEGAYGVHPAQRRNHTKGIGVLGTFTGAPAAARWSRSTLFSGAEIPVVGRFSPAGGNPHASDLEKSPRGVGLQFRLPGGALQHMTMLHTPMFFARVPQTFLDKFVALRVDPHTGKDDPQRFERFNETHPDQVAQTQFLHARNPPASYANCAFYGIHTFRFVNAKGTITHVRWRFVPRDGERQLSNDELAIFSPNFLEPALRKRLARGRVKWDMVVSIGEPGDSIVDPTVLWPSDRREFTAGTLTLTSAMTQQQAGSYLINFDPLVMADGIEATDDPVLLFRSQTYGISYSRRLRDV
jgi:catalase